MKTKELRILSEKELDDKYLDLKKELIKINAQIAMGTVPENPGKIKEIRKTIARIKTLQKTKGGQE